MKKTFTASFEEVEDIIDQSEIDELYEGKSRKIKAKDVISVFITYIVLLIPLYFLYFISWGLVWGMRENPEELTGPVDKTNRYITMLDNFHYVHWVALLFLITIVIFLFIRKKDILKASLLYNVSLTLYIMAVIVYAFRLSQLFIYNGVLRNVYLVLFLAVIIYIIYLCFKKANKFIFNLDEQLKKPRWNITGKQVVSVAIPLFGIYQVFKVTGFGQKSMELENAFIGATLDLLPLIVIFTPFLFLMFVKPLVRYFYLTKYSEQFREKFNYDNDHWNGQL